MANNTSLYGSNGNVLPAGDNVIITGTLTVNGCSILTDCSAFNLLPFNANTLNIGLESTTLALGATTGVTTVRNQLATANYDFPIADGTANQVLKTDGAGNLSFVSIGSLGVVTSITGTANQVIASSPTGAVTLSLPQDIATTSNPVFAGITGGNVTVGIADNQTISTTTGALYLNSALTSGAQIYIGNNADELQTGFSSPSNSLLFTDNFINGNLASRKYNVNNNAVAYPLRIEAVAGTAVTPGAGYGVGMYAGMTNASGTFLTAANIDVSWTDATAATEDSKFAVSLLRNGAMTLASSLDSNGNLTLAGGIKVSGSTSGSSTFNAPATGSNLIYTLPGTAGASSTVLTNDGSGNLSWALPGGGGSTFGNITIAVVDDNTIGTTTGDLIIQPATGQVVINAIVDIAGDYLNLNSDDTANDAAMRFGNSSEIRYNRTADRFEFNKNTQFQNSVEITNSLNVDNGTLFVDPTNNRVGVNTNAPLQELTVNAGGDGYCQIGMENTERTWLVTNNDGDDLVSYSVVIPSPFSVTNRFQFDTVGGDQWFNSGRLGVGTATPAYELDVSGTGRFTSNLIATGGFTLNGTTSGYSDFVQPAIGANISYTLPAAQGAANTVLTNDGSGVLSWAATGNPFDQSLNTTDAVEFASVKSSIIFVDELRPFDASSTDVRMITTGSGTYQTGKADIVVEESVSYPNGIASVVVNSNIWDFLPDGRTAFPGYTFPAADGAVNEVLTTDGSGNVFWALPGGGGSTFGNISIGVVTDNTIASTDTNGDITIQPNGSGIVNLFADIVKIGDANTNAAITTNGTGNLSLNTNFNTNSGNITITQGVDGNITLDPNGTGIVSITKDVVGQGDIQGNTISISTQATIDENTTTTTSTGPIDLISTSRSSMKCIISVVDDITLERHVLEALLLKKGSNAYITTYAEIYSNVALATFSADVSAGDLRLLADPASTNSTTFTVIRTSIN
jgi:hypothetical protein